MTKQPTTATERATQRLARANNNAKLMADKYIGQLDQLDNLINSLQALRNSAKICVGQPNHGDIGSLGFATQKLQEIIDHYNFH